MKSRRKRTTTRKLFSLVESALLLVYEVRISSTLEVVQQTKIGKAQELLERALKMLRGK